MIRIHARDNDDEARARQEQIEKRLEELGPETVRMLIGHGLPTEWNAVIFDWLKHRKTGE